MGNAFYRLDLTYECLGGDTFLVQLAFYRDCDGIDAPGIGGEPLPTIDISSASCAQNFNATLNLISTQEAGTVCSSLQTTCSGGPYPGIEEYIYNDTIILPTTCVDWIFSYGLCCRNNAINTITPTNVNIYVEATLNNVTAICNNSPIFSNTPVPFVCIGSPYCFNNGAVDPDGDSLAYKLVTPTIGPNPGDTVNYVPGYSPTDPITSTPGLSLDPVTGDICMTPTQLEVTVMQVQIEEWRNGVLIGTVERDIQIRVIDCLVPNNLPSVNGINGTGVFTASICAGDSFCFFTESIDLDTSQTLTMSWNAGITDATFNISPGPRPVGNFCWLPDSSDISTAPHCFTLTITDDNCPFLGSQVFSFCITVFGYLSTNTTSQDVSCLGDCDGQATINVIDGVPPFTYLWDDPLNQGTPTANNLCPNNYNVTITDSLGCSSTQPVTVGSPTALAITIDSTAITCNGLGNGTGTVSASGGNGGYNYLWNSTPNQIAPTATNLTSGTYTVTVTDIEGCDTSASITIIEPPTLSTTISNFTDVLCNGMNNGNATITINGGTTPYSVLWDAAASNQTTNTASGLTAGNYSVVVTDSNNCVDSTSVTINEPTVLSTSISNLININCFGGNDGSATVNALGGTTPYSFLWDPSTGNQTDSTATTLFVGSYGVLVTDSNGCTDSVATTIMEPASVISLTITTTDVSCFGGNNGLATATPSGGTPPYSYLWGASAGNQTDSTATGLSAGVYDITVSDINDCVYDPNIVINEPAPLNVTTLSDSVNCFGGNNGSATISINGGTSPYTILWDAATGNQTDSTAINLTTGTYFVNITDTNGCMIDTSVTVEQPIAPLTLNTSVTNLNCFGDTNGTATVSISGGTSPYTILWDATTGNQTDSIAINLITGNYEVLVTDTNNCIDSATIIVSQPVLPLSLDTILKDVNCFSGSDGRITLIPSGGTSPYTYLWNPLVANTTDSIADNLSVGNYKVIITDTNGCIDSLTSTIVEPDTLVLTITPNDTICPGSIATIGAMATGGNGGNIFSWNQGLPDSPNHNVSPDSATTYLISVSDNLGCNGNIDSTTVYVYYIDLNGLITSSTGDICEGDSTTISGSYSGGIGDVTFNWNQGLGNNLGTFNVSPSDSTDYILTVTDQCNNSISDTITVKVSAYPIINLPTIYGEGCAALTVNFVDSLNNDTDLDYLWNFGDGFTSTLQNPSYTYTDAGTYNVTLSITSSKGCTSVSSTNSVVNVYPKPTASFSASPTITDTQNPTIRFTNSSINHLTNLWSFGNGDTSITNNPAYTYPDTGTYIVNLLVTNQFGCIDEFEIPITINPFYTFRTPNAFTPNANGGNGGSYDINSLTNDIFYPFTEFVEEFQLMIFNRWGELLFVSEDIYIGWDGYYRGNICQQDTYVWKINITYSDGQKISKVGDLTLMR